MTRGFSCSLQTGIKSFNFLLITNSADKYLQFLQLSIGGLR